MSITINLWIAAGLYFGSLAALWMASRPSKEQNTLTDELNFEPGSPSIIAMRSEYQPLPQNPKTQVITITIDGNAIITHEQVADLIDALKARAQQ